MRASLRGFHVFCSMRMSLTTSMQIGLRSPKALIIFRRLQSCIGRSHRHGRVPVNPNSFALALSLLSALCCCSISHFLGPTVLKCAASSSAIPMAPRERSKDVHSHNEALTVFDNFVEGVFAAALTSNVDATGVANEGESSRRRSKRLHKDEEAVSSKDIAKVVEEEPKCTKVSSRTLNRTSFWSFNFLARLPNRLPNFRSAAPRVG